MSQFAIMNEFNIYNILQIKEIEEHKYYLSEEYKHEITMEEALQDWCTVKHGGLTYAEIWSIKYFNHRTKLIDSCENKCVSSCCGLDSCPFTKQEIHKILKD